MSFFVFNDAADKSCKAFKDSGSALIAEVKFTPYWDGFYHLSAITTILGHIARCLWNLLSLTLTVLTAPFLIFMPWHIPSLPVIVIAHATTAALSAITAVIQPCMFIVRSLMSLAYGYQDGADHDWDYCSSEDEEFNDWKTAMYPF